MDHQVEDPEQLSNAVRIVRYSRTQLCDDHYYEVWELLHSVRSV